MLAAGDTVPAAVVIAVLLSTFVVTGDSRIGVETEELVDVSKITGGSVNSGVANPAGSGVTVVMAGSVPMSAYLNTVAVGTSCTLARTAVIRPATRITQIPIKEKTATPTGIRRLRSNDGWLSMLPQISCA